MRSLSNLFRGSDRRDRGNRSAGEDSPIECRPAYREEIHPALRLILGADQDQQLSDFLSFAGERQLDLGRIWIAHRQEQLLWSILPVVSPGRTMLWFSPGDLNRPQQAQAAAKLTAVLCEHYRREVHLAQILLDPNDGSTRQAYEACGFQRLAQLDYLQATLWRRVDPPPLPSGLIWQSYSPHTHGLFAKAILESYQDSQDCPALNGRRDIEDILAGHKATGLFDPDRWFLLRQDQRALGVLLLSASPRSDAMELVYLGLVPEARGRGLADLLLRQALWAVRGAGKSRLALAVDAANPRALKLYHRHGLRHIASKLALMRDLRAEPTSTTA